MAISYPLSLPSSIGIAQIDIRAVNSVAYSQSPFTYAGQAHAYTGQMWQADITIPPVRRDLAAPWKAFLTSLRGQFGTFLLGDPDYNTARGKAGSASTWFLEGGSLVTEGAWDDTKSYTFVDEGGITAFPVISGNQSLGSSTLNIRGFTPSVSGVFLAGDYIQVGSGITARLHQILQDADSNSSGVVSLDIWPHLRYNVTDGSPVVINSPKGLFRLASNEAAWSIDNNSAYNISFGAMEAL